MKYLVISSVYNLTKKLLWSQQSYDSSHQTFDVLQLRIISSFSFVAARNSALLSVEYCFKRKPAMYMCVWMCSWFLSSGHAPVSSRSQVEISNSVTYAVLDNSMRSKVQLKNIFVSLSNRDFEKFFRGSVSIVQIDKFMAANASFYLNCLSSRY